MKIAIRVILTALLMFLEALVYAVVLTPDGASPTMDTMAALFIIATPIIIYIYFRKKNEHA